MNPEAVGWLRQYQARLALVLVSLRLAGTLVLRGAALPQVAWACSAALLAGCLWWVARRQITPGAGLLALLLFLAAPVWQGGVDVGASLGLFVLLFTAEGVAHAVQGPRHKWLPRMALLAAAVAVTATARPSAAWLGLALSAGCMAYLGQGRRMLLAGVLAAAAGVATLSALARPTLVGAAPRLFLRVPTPHSAMALSGVLVAVAAAFVLWSTSRRSRFFGNTTPLLAAAGCLLLQQPAWALPLGLLFVAGVFADGFASRRRRLWLGVAAACVLAQALAVVLLYAHVPFRGR